VNEGRNKTVGVLGGMGPAATVHFLQALLAATGATRDQDHLRVLVDNNPHLPDRNRAIAGEGPSPGPQLATMARGLERAGAQLLVMPCNTAHAFQAEIEAAVTAPFLSIVDVTVDAVLRAQPNAGRVGLLAAPGALRAGLYQRAFAARGIDTVAPAGALYEQLRALIYAVKAGDLGPGTRAGMQGVARGLAGEGAEALVAACTEVPLVLTAAESPVPLIDCTAELAAATVIAARG
jgi:aspartate racemase